MLNSGYKPGKLYRIKYYPNNSFVLWSANTTTSPQWGEHEYRFRICFCPVDKDVIFMYLNFIEGMDRGKTTGAYFHLVIYQNLVGAVDAKMELEELVSPEE